KRRAAPPVRRTVAQSAPTTRPQPTVPGQRMAAPKPSDDTIRRAQQALERAGYEIGTPDGQMGQRTVAAIKRFQTDRYLSVTGQLDQTTLAALGVASATGTSSMPHVAALTDAVNAMASYAGKSGREILAATNAGLYRTSDPALGWDRLPYGQGLDNRTTCVSTSAQNPSVIYVGTTTSGVLVSRNGGDSWQQVSGIPNTAPVNVIVQDPQRAAYVYVGTKQAFYMSHDNGE